MIYGLIIAAGKQSRFESDIPKALVPYKGRRLLDINVDIMKSVCDVVYVVQTRVKNYVMGSTVFQLIPGMVVEMQFTKHYVV